MTRGGNGWMDADGIAFPKPHPMHTFTLSEPPPAVAPAPPHTHSLPFTSHPSHSDESMSTTTATTSAMILYFIASGQASERAGWSKRREMFVVFVKLKPLANIWLCVHIIYWNIGIVLMKDLTFPKCVYSLTVCRCTGRAMWTIWKLSACVHSSVDLVI